MHCHNIKPSAPPLPEHHNYIDQYVQRIDPYSIEPSRHEGETVNEWVVKQQNIGTSQSYYSYPPYRYEIDYYNPPQQVIQVQEPKKKSLISRFFIKLCQFLCCPLCCCVYGCMEYC